MKYEFIVEQQNNNVKLGAFLRIMGLSCTLVRSVKYLENGLMVEGQRAKTNQILSEGQKVCVNVPYTESNKLSACDIEVAIEYESEEVIVYNKPAGMATHPTLNQKDGTLANVYAALIKKRGINDSFRPTNRLDKNTSGLVLAAKSRLGANCLAKSSDKSYLAVVQGVVALDKGIIDAPIDRDPTSIIKRCVAKTGQPSITEYEVIERFFDHTLVHVHTLTGRTHQIRVHLSSIGHPLAGDDLYGGGTELINRHALHCVQMSFLEPVTNEKIDLSCALANDIEQLTCTLRKKDEYCKD